jgi:hypothetical protein
VASFPDIEDALCDVLADLAYTGTETPADLQALLAASSGTGNVIRVRRVGGPDDGITDTARIDIDCFATRRSAVVALAETVRQRLISGPHATGSTVIDYVTTETGPVDLPWDDPKVRRRTATYTVRARRVRTTP